MSSFRNRFKKSLWKGFMLAILACGLKMATAQPVEAASGVPSLGALASIPSGFVLSLTHDYSTGRITYQLSWEAVTPSTDTAKVTYYVFTATGAQVPDFSSFGNAVFTTDKTAISLSGLGEGTISFIVVSSDNISGLLQKSDTKVHNWIHNLTSEGILRADGDGTQRGIDQKWTFTYSLDDDTFFTARIYPRTTAFLEDSAGFITTAATPLKTLVENTPRSFEMVQHTVTMQETWDSRSSSGTIVPNDIYWILMTAKDVFGVVRGNFLTTIPVDIIRIMNLKTTGITSNTPTASISYDLTGDAQVRVVIAQPGSAFTVDSNGDIQAISRTTGLIDNSLVVSTFTFQRKAGAQTETWDGTSSTGTVVASGVYSVGISATDPYGNHAIDSSGNDAPIFTTLTLERKVSAGSGAVADTTPPTLTSISPANGAVVTGSLSTMTIVLADSQSSLNLTGTAVTVRDPNNTIVPVNTSNNGRDTITVTFNPAITAGGAYSVTVAALDTAGNSSSLTSTFVISNTLSASAFSDSMIIYPNPAKGTNVTFQYSLAVAATVNLEIFNSLGEKVYSTSFTDPQGTASHTWDRRNSSGEEVGSGLYLARFKADNSGSAIKTVKKIVVIR